MTEIINELPNKSLLLPAEVAQVLRVSVASVYRLCDEDKLKAMKVRGSRRITKESVINFLNIMLES